jgi:hypothetical protein
VKPCRKIILASLNMVIKLHKRSFKYLFIVVHCLNHRARAAQRGTERGGTAEYRTRNIECRRKREEPQRHGRHREARKGKFVVCSF